MIRKGDIVLDALEIWQRLAGPKKSVQWQDHRSAKESARAWLEGDPKGQIPEELLAVLSTHEDFGKVLEWEAEPESLVSFDEYGGPANIDVLVSGRDERGRFVLAIEAKADESFGPLVGRALTDALERRLASPSSQGLARLEELARHLLGAAQKGRPSLDKIRYQLLTASAAALSHAKQVGATRAVVMVHEFRTPRTKPENHSRNGQDLVLFLKRLGVNDAERVSTGELLGPIAVPGGGRFENPPPLYIGKATRTLGGGDVVVEPG